jgi:hypothetical protein
MPRDQFLDKIGNAHRLVAQLLLNGKAGVARIIEDGQGFILPRDDSDAVMGS